MTRYEERRRVVRWNDIIYVREARFDGPITSPNSSGVAKIVEPIITVKTKLVPREKTVIELFKITLRYEYDPNPIEEYLYTIY